MAISKITTSGVATDTLTAADLAPNSVDSSELVDGSVDLSHMSANSVDSDQYVDGSIDTAHIGDDQVTGAKIENNPTIAGNLTVTGDIVPSTPLSHRNMIINGAMQVAQRSSVAFAHDGTIAGYSEVDRYRLETDSLGEWDGTLTQHDMTSAELNTTGFGKALKLTTGTAESSIGSNDIVYITQKIEAQNLQHLQYGTASAKTVTLSFWVKTSVAGTYSLGLYKPDGTARNITATYTTTGTGWEYKTITFAGDTGAGTIDNNNGEGLRLFWNLASGSTYDSSENTSWHNYANASFAGGHAQDGIITTASATFLLTGVQLELGSNATPFEHRSFGDELARCQRYYQKSNTLAIAPGSNEPKSTIHLMSWGDGNCSGFPFFQRMRDEPTVTLYGASGASGKVGSAGVDKDAVATYIGQTQISFINVTSGSATTYCKFGWKAEVEL